MSGLTDILMGPIKETMSNYYSDRSYLLICVLAVIFLAIISKEHRIKLVYPMLLVLLVITNPILYRYVYSKIVYKRIFWLMLDYIIIPAAGITLIRRIKSRVAQLLVFVAMVAVLMVSGNFYMSKTSYDRFGNVEKVPPVTKSIGDVLLSYEEEPQIVAPVEVAVLMHTYNENIYPMFGRDTVGFIMAATPRCKLIARTYDREKPDYERIFFYAVCEKRSFVITPEDKPVNTAISDKYGYELLTNESGYDIYYRRDFKDGSRMYRVATIIDEIDGENVVAGYVCEDTDGMLTIVDGGRNTINARLFNYIKDNNYCVDRWIITEADSDYTFIYEKLSKDKTVRIMETSEDISSVDILKKLDKLPELKTRSNRIRTYYISE